MLEKYEVCCDLFHGFDRSVWKTGTLEERLRLLPVVQDTSWPWKTARTASSRP